MWKERLTESDENLFRMVRSLIGECEPKNGGDHYFFEVKYNGKDMDYLAGIMAAIEGRMGDRLLRFEDLPDAGCFIVYVKFDKVNPAGEYRIGMKFCKKVADVRALPVNFRFAKLLRRFIGNGAFCQVDEGDLFKFTADGKIWSAKVGDWVVCEDGHYFVAPKNLFKMHYERKFEGNLPQV